MRTMTRTLSGLALLLAVSIAGAQQPGQLKLDVVAKPKKSALEEALDLALKNNPDLRVVVSKVALADAELHRTRLQVAQKVAAAYADVILQRAVLKEMERQLTVTRKFFERGGASREELGKAELPVVEMKAKVAAAERELDHLQGKGGRDMKSAGATLGMLYRARPAYNLTTIDLGNDAGVHFYSSLVDSGTVKTEGSNKLRQALRKKATLSVKKMTLENYLALVRKTAGGLSVHANTKEPAWNEIVDFEFDDVTIGGMLQFLEDSLPGHQIVVREYGLLVVPKEKVPPGALTLSAFLHAEPAKPAAEKPHISATTTPKR
jgi:hypothetical protein